MCLSAKWPWWLGWKVYVGSATCTATHRGWTGYSHCWVPNLPAAQTNADMAPFPRVTSQLPGGRLITLACFHHERHRILFLVKKTFAFYVLLPQMIYSLKNRNSNINKTINLMYFDTFLPIDESHWKIIYGHFFVQLKKGWLSYVHVHTILECSN